jgi:hypothetical protein
MSANDVFGYGRDPTGVVRIANRKVGFKCFLRTAILTRSYPFVASGGVRGRSGGVRASEQLWRTNPRVRIK